MESYFKILEDRKKYGDSVLRNIESVREVISITQNPSRFSTASIQYFPRPQPQNMLTTTEEVAPKNLPETHRNNTFLLPAAPLLPSIAPVYSRQYFPPAPSYLIANTMFTPLKKPKNKRTCSVCKINDCGGRSKRYLCNNKCGICNLYICTGRYKTSPCINNTTSLNDE